MKRALLVLTLLCVQPYGHMASEDESNPLLDMASMFIQEALTNQNGAGAAAGGGGAGAGLAGIASLVGSFMQANGKADAGGGGGAMQILSGLGSLLASNSRGGNGGGGFDPAIIGNVLEMFTQGDDDAADNGQKRSSNSGGSESGIGLDTILQVASAFMNTQGAGEKPSGSATHHHQQKRSVPEEPEQENGFMNLLPLIMQAVTSFAGPEGQSTQERHKSHAWVLPPFLEHIHVLWDHFSNSELADALYEKSGVNKIMKV